MADMTGITPGKETILTSLPSHRQAHFVHLDLAEPGVEHLWRYLLTFVFELREGWSKDIYVKTPSTPDGRPILIVLAAVVEDRPASIAVTGAAHWRNLDNLCPLCLAKHSELKCKEGKL